MHQLQHAATTCVVIMHAHDHWAMCAVKYIVPCSLVVRVHCQPFCIEQYLLWSNVELHFPMVCGTQFTQLATLTTSDRTAKIAERRLNYWPPHATSLPSP